MSDTVFGGSGFGILVADDDEAIRHLLGIFLPMQGFNVWLAADGNSALQLYKEHWRRIQAVLIDVLMPGRDGPETVALLRLVSPRLPCCFMTGDSGRYTPAELYAAGATYILTKPLSLQLVESTLRQLCGTRWSASAGCKAVAAK